MLLFPDFELVSVLLEKLFELLDWSLLKHFELREILLKVCYELGHPIIERIF